MGPRFLGERVRYKPRLADRVTTATLEPGVVVWEPAEITDIVQIPRANGTTFAQFTVRLERDNSLHTACVFRLKPLGNEREKP